MQTKTKQNRHHKITILPIYMLESSLSFEVKYSAIVQYVGNKAKGRIF